MKREWLEFLADNPLYTKRFAYLCRAALSARLDHGGGRGAALDWHTVKELEKQYMRGAARPRGYARAHR